MESLSSSDPVVQSFIFYSAILALKVLFLAPFTTIKRRAKGVVANPEDAKYRGATVKFDDPDVEQVRRAHLNDLENIPAFWILGALYLTTGPTAYVAVNLFRVYTLCRFIHTIAYAVKPMGSPWRGIGFDIPYLLKLYMGVQVVYSYMNI